MKRLRVRISQLRNDVSVLPVDREFRMKGYNHISLSWESTAANVMDQPTDAFGCVTQAEMLEAGKMLKDTNACHIGTISIQTAIHKIAGCHGK